MPDILVGLQTEDADLVGFRGTHLAGPYHAEFGFAPQPPYFEDLARSGEKAHAI